MSQQKIQIMLVDDHTVVRGGLRYALQVFDDLELVGEAGDGQTAVELCGRLQPDIVLMDLSMDGMDGVAATEAICEQYPQVQVIVLTSFQDGGLVKRALRAGAAGYLLKTISIDKLTEAIRAVHGGEPILAPEATQALITMTRQPPQLGHDLTSRENQVLALLVVGYSNADIAKKLSISLSTARHHVSMVISKLDASNRAEAAALAVQHGLVTGVGSK